MMYIDPIIKNILINRGYTSQKMIDEYFSDRPQLTYDPFLMKGMNDAVEKILDFTSTGRRICIYGDYDTDGVTSVTLMMTLLKRLTDNVTYFIPSRFREGYGLNDDALDRIKADGTELVITVDCGCNACEQVEHARALGMEIIVTDHHTMDERIPECIIVNPKQEDDTYPFSGLCGCGVAFKLAQAISRKCGMGKEVLNEVLDIVGIATIGDIVPLRDENRTLVKYGMNRTRKCRRPGLRYLMDRAHIEPESINSKDIAFGIVPRLNSAGRLRSADISARLLMSEVEDSASLADELNSLNEERKGLQDNIFAEACKYIDSRTAENGTDDFIIYYAGSANEGVTGIVAGKLRERYNRPVVILTDMEEPSVVKGTGRSIEGIHLYEFLDPCIDMFRSFGGHAGACGFTLYRDRMEEFTDYVYSAAHGIAEDHPELFEGRIVTEADIDASDMTFALAENIEKMEPFGSENPRPVFTIRDIFVKNIISMGKQDQYRKLICEGSSGSRFQCVVFDQKVVDNMDISTGDIIDVKGDISVNRWNGRSTLQVEVKEIVVSALTL